MQHLTPRYKKDAPSEDLPKAAELPTLKICQVGENNKLILPRDVRAQFLQDPVWGVEWRQIVTEFDKQWSTPLPDSPATQSTTASPDGSQTLGSPVKEEAHLTGSFDWSAHFPDEPTKLDDVKQKYPDFTEMPGGTSFNFILVPGPKIFVVATDAMSIKASNAAIMSHGAGVWLLGEKADKFEGEHPGRGVPCKWSDDQGLVVLEDTGCQIGFTVKKHVQSFSTDGVDL